MKRAMKPIMNHILDNDAKEHLPNPREKSWKRKAHLEIEHAEKRIREINQRIDDQDVILKQIQHGLLVIRSIRVFLLLNLVPLHKLKLVDNEEQKSTNHVTEVHEGIESNDNVNGSTKVMNKVNPTFFNKIRRRNI